MKKRPMGISRWIETIQELGNFECGSDATSPRQIAVDSVSLHLRHCDKHEHTRCGDGEPGKTVGFRHDQSQVCSLPK